MSAVRTFLLYSKEASNCEECGYDLGGTNQPAPKKPKRNCPSAVLFVGSSHFSCKTSTKDDRCFFIKEGESVFCSQKQCMDVRATFVSSGRAANFSCKHADLSNKREWQTFTSCQNAAYSNKIVFICWVDYALEGSAFILSKCDFSRMFHTERS